MQLQPVVVVVVVVAVNVAVVVDSVEDSEVEVVGAVGEVAGAEVVGAARTLTRNGSR
jgi:hypothetical protein